MFKNNPNYAVRFDETVDFGMGKDNKAFPYIYNFIDRENDNWEVNKATNQFDGLGINIAPGATVDHFIKIDPDYPYKMLWAKYTAYYADTRGAAALTGTGTLVAGDNTLTGAATIFLTELIPGDHITVNGVAFRVDSITDDTHLELKETPTPAQAGAGLTLARTAYTWYMWYNDIFSANTGMFDDQDYQTNIGTPLTRFIDISFSFQSPDMRVLYGGLNLDPTLITTGGYVPVPIRVLQGYDFGMGQLITPYLLPREAMLKLQITNTHTVKTLTVGGMIYGMKVRL